MRLIKFALTQKDIMNLRALPSRDPALHVFKFPMPILGEPFYTGATLGRIHATVKLPSGEYVRVVNRKPQAIIATSRTVKAPGGALVPHVGPQELYIMMHELSERRWAPGISKARRLAEIGQRRPYFSHISPAVLLDEINLVSALGGIRSERARRWAGYVMEPRISEYGQLIRDIKRTIGPEAAKTVEAAVMGRGRVPKRLKKMVHELWMEGKIEPPKFKAYFRPSWTEMRMAGGPLSYAKQKSLGIMRIAAPEYVKRQRAFFENVVGGVMERSAEVKKLDRSLGKKLEGAIKASRGKPAARGGIVNKFVKFLRKLKRLR